MGEKLFERQNPHFGAELKQETVEIFAKQPSGFFLVKFRICPMYDDPANKFLGFTPDTVNKHVIEAETDNAPADSLQKIQGKWLCLADIENVENRRRVQDLVAKTGPLRT